MKIGAINTTRPTFLSKSPTDTPRLAAYNELPEFVDTLGEEDEVLNDMGGGANAEFTQIVGEFSTDPASKQTRLFGGITKKLRESCLDFYKKKFPEHEKFFAGLDDALLPLPHMAFSELGTSIMGPNMGSIVDAALAGESLDFATDIELLILGMVALQSYDKGKFKREGQKKGAVVLISVARYILEFKMDKAIFEKIKDCSFVTSFPMDKLPPDALKKLYDSVRAWTSKWFQRYSRQAIVDQARTKAAQ